MDATGSSPKRVRDDDVRNLPSPKRTCLGAEPAEPHQPKADSNPGTPFDDADDLYDTPSASVFQPTMNVSTGGLQTPEARENRPMFKLPGLGPSIDEQHEMHFNRVSSSTSPAQDLGNSGSYLEHPSELNGLQETQVEPVEITDSHKTNGPQVQPHENIVQAHSRRVGTDVAIDESSYPSTSTAKEIFPEGGVESSVLAGPKGDKRASSISNTSGRFTDIGVTTLSGKLPPVAVGSEDVQSDAQPTEGQVAASDGSEAFSETHQSRILDAAQPITAMSNSSSELDVLKQANDGPEQAEFEIDSSPIESSSTDSTSDTGSSDESDDYELLSPEEQARRLMQEDMGSDDEGGGKTGNGTLSGALRTTNEKPEEVVPKPDLTITPDMSIEELGDVEVLVENLALIKAKTSGEYQVLEIGSVLCLRDRSVIGVVAETIGRVQQPYYSVRFTNAAAIGEAGLAKGTQIFYVEQHSTTVFTQPLKAYKGSDASNLHDEEVGDDEMEFSDDEKEAEYKRKLKQAKQARREGRPVDSDGYSRGPGRGRGGSRGRPGHRGGRPGRDGLAQDVSGSINYDDMEVDGPYTPLARPTNLHEMMGRSEAPIETHVHGNDSGGGYNETRGAGRRGRGRGRGDRDRSGRGRGGQTSQDGNRMPTNRDPVGPSWNGITQPQQDSPYGLHHQQYTYPPAQYSPQPAYTSNFSSMQTQPNAPPANHASYQQPQFMRQPYQNFQPQTSETRIPPGTFINPAFFSKSPQGNQYPTRYPFSPQ